MTTTTYTLPLLHSLFSVNGINALSNESVEITLDNSYDVSLIQLSSQDDKQFFWFTNNTTNLNTVYWCDDNTHFVTVTENVTVENVTVENAIVDDVSVIADLCSNLDIHQLIQLQDKINSLMKKQARLNDKKVRSTQSSQNNTTEKSRVSAKNFNYYQLLLNWYNSALSARAIAEDTGLSQNYGAATIAEDMRVIKVLMGADKDLVIGQQWSEYLVWYWSQNSDTTWQKLHYAFSKSGRKSNNVDLLCQYVIGNATKEQIETAIAAQQ